MAFTRAFSTLLLAGLVMVQITACTIDQKTDGAAQSVAPTTSVVVAQAPQASVKDGASKVPPNKPVLVKSLGDGLSSVTMTNEEGYQVKGEMDADMMGWTTAEDLGFNREYTLVATDKNGEKTTAAFSTIKPNSLVNTSLAPLDGAEVGVGQTIAVIFDSYVENRKAVQDAIRITTEPKVDGAFYWISNQQVRWRPETFWEPGTKVSVDANLYGIELADGVYANNGNKADFTIGSRVEAIVDDSTKAMTIFKDGEAVKTMPVSLGSDKWPTPNGIYIIGDQYESLLMDSSTFGLSVADGGYRTPVSYATQMSYSGIFVHAAPWSLGAQGNSNVSHGCVNVSTENAAWFQNFVKRGDIVTVKNTKGGILSVYDGLGDWNIEWEQWKAGNASIS
ncbi:MULTISPECIES: Ig-like domain-containing protein [unclassified Corynebacterium]|uniref:L,D-transpeptidase n=1 Tax=unclassified Corynebacterium TaxID=2624378 RepID=UPI002168504B|nr:Ig-like domain-containing protein [Corynebacterium sp. ES2715-CONJ3]MCS4532559.1 Ig-like domain-containing protein [Corynebacterium sp. ES2730-CONJ]